MKRGIAVGGRNVLILTHKYDIFTLVKAKKMCLVDEKQDWKIGKNK